jgi:hypothetical protein
MRSWAASINKDAGRSSTTFVYRETASRSIFCSLAENRWRLRAGGAPRISVEQDKDSRASSFPAQARWSPSRPGDGKPARERKCEVLRGQCRRSNAGLYFDDYYEFREALSLLEQSPELRAGLGANGRRFYHQNYRWEVVEGKYNRLLETLSRDDRALPSAPKRGFFARLFS